MSCIEYIINALKRYVNVKENMINFDVLSVDEIDRVKKISIQNKVLPVLSDALFNDGQDNILVSEGNKINSLNELSFMLRIREYKKLIGTLEDNDVNYALVKGIYIGKKAYNNPFDRVSNDMDFLVQYEHVPIVEQILLEAGYKQAYLAASGLQEYTRESKIFYIMNTHSIAPFRKVSNNVLYEIDVNFYAHMEKEKTIPAADFLKEKRHIDLFGQKVSVLDDTFAFLYVLLHHYRESNSIYHIYCGQDFNLLKACDIYFSYMRCRIDKTRLFDLINKYGLSNEFLNITNSVRKIFGDFLIDEVDHALYKDVRGSNSIKWPIDLPNRLELANRFDLVKESLDNLNKNILDKNIAFLK